MTARAIIRAQTAGRLGQFDTFSAFTKAIGEGLDVTPPEAESLATDILELWMEGHDGLYSPDIRERIGDSWRLAVQPQQIDEVLGPDIDECNSTSEE